MRSHGGGGGLSSPACHGSLPLVWPEWPVLAREDHQAGKCRVWLLKVGQAGDGQVRERG